MLKNCAKRKLIVTSFTLIVFLITLTFPKTEEKIKDITISYMSGTPRPIYVINQSNLVAMVNVNVKNNETLEMTKEIINLLTIGSDKSEYLPNVFRPILPADTKIENISLDGSTLKISFNEAFLNMPEDTLRKAIECLVYSLTEIDGIDGVLIYIGDNLLNNIPNVSANSNKPLTRAIGVNEMYYLDSLKNSIKTTVYYIFSENDLTYYIPVTLLNQTDKEKVEIIIDRLKSRPHVKTNLISYLNASATISSYELVDKTLTLNFNDSLYEGLSSEELKEEVKYSIVLSMKDSLDVKDVIIKSA